MTRSFSEYKASSQQWLDMLPSHWAEVPFWTMFTRESRRGSDGETLLSVYRDHGVVPKDSRTDNFNKPSEDLSSYQLVEPGDLVVNKMKAWQGSLSISRFRGVVSPAYFIYRPHHDADDRFLHYVLRSSPFVAAYAALSKGVRVNQWDLEPQSFSRLKVPVPPPSEQRVIANYLDRETAQIDTLIKEQQRLIDMLNERRVSVVRRATRSLEGVVDKLGRLTKIGNGSTPNRENLDYWTNGSVPWLNSSVVNADSVSTADQFVTALALEECHLPMVPPGSVLVGLTGQGRTRGMATLLLAAATVNQHVAFVTPEPDAWMPRYLMWSLVGAYQDLRELSEENGSTKGGLTCGDLKSFRLVRPPLERQMEITAYLDEQTSAIDAMIVESERLIDLSSERRTALITAVVTGKIDVRGEVT